MSCGALLVLTTCGNVREADDLARAVVEQKLAACVNRIEGIVSTYRWKSKIEREPEVLLLIKTTEDRYPELMSAIQRQTSYELPEVLAVPLHGGSTEYLKWLADSVTLKE